MEDNKAAATLRFSHLPVLLAAGVFFARLVAMLSAPIEGLRGYGDLLHYYLVYGLPGWPILNYWVEYPPVFPWLSALVYRLAGGQEHVFYYLIGFILILADAGSMYLFCRLVQRLFPSEGVLSRAVIYLLVLVALPYSWWYYEPLAVFALLLGLTQILEGRLFRGGAALALGIALKFFPGLGLLAAWRRFSWRQISRLALVSLAPVILMYVIFLLASPDFTVASLRSQASKGSWETVWALLDGNINTGSLGPVQDRLDPVRAGVTEHNRAVVHPLVSLMVFGGAGLWGLSRFKRCSDSPTLCDRQSLALVGFGWSLFLLWSPGWSPQWVLYLLPLILLALPDRQVYLLVIALVLVNLLEWPVLLSRGYFWALWITIVIRTLLLVILAAGFFSEMSNSQQPTQAAPNGMV